MIKGVPLSPGIARGTAFPVRAVSELTAPQRPIASQGIAAEAARFRLACRQAAAELAALREAVVRKAGAEVGGIFDAQALLLVDPLFLGQVCRRIETDEVAAETALVAVVPELAGALEIVDEEDFRARAADLRDVARRILAALGVDSQAGPEMPADVVLVASEIEPSWIVNLDLGKVRAVVTGHGAKNSHAAILLRSLGLPAVGGLTDADAQVPSGRPVLVDGIAGLAFVDPGRGVLAEYARLEADLQAHDEELAAEVSRPAVTADGTVIRLAANIGKIADTEAALRFNADGIGLYRTEFAFDIRDGFPSEDEQWAILEAVARRLHPRPVVFRVLDLGADKPLPYLPLPAAPNPALHLRGIRLMLAHPEILRTQMRAILRTSARHPVSIMLPMVGGLDEVRECRRLLDEAKAELERAGVPFDPALPFGAMIEVPSATLVAADLARELDFLSLGTNDLVQYLLAVDRDDPAMAAYYQTLHPAVVRSIAALVRAAARAGKELTICGEMAGDPACTALLVGLGLRSFSVAPRQLPEVKHEIRQTDCRAAARLARRALRLRTQDEILRLLAAGARPAAAATI